MTRIAAVAIGETAIDGTGPEGNVLRRPFHLGRSCHDLSRVLSEVLERLGAFETLGVTIAGELPACFATRHDDACHVLASVKAAVVRRCPSPPAPGRKRRWTEVLVWRTDGHLVSIFQALGDPLPSVGADWLALALEAGALAPRGHSVLVAVGSAHTHVVPLQDGTPSPAALAGTQRLIAGELLPVGVSRTPLASLAASLPYRGAACPVLGEPLATARDVYLLLGKLPETPADTDTADGRAATRPRALERLARTICADATTFHERDGLEAARCVMAEQGRRLTDAIDALASRRGTAFETAVICGEGEFLARSAVEGRVPRVIAWSDALGEEISRIPASYALWRRVCRAREPQGAPSREHLGEGDS